MKLKLYTFALMGALVFQHSAMTQTTSDTNVATPTVPAVTRSVWPTNSMASAASMAAQAPSAVAANQTVPATPASGPAAAAAAPANPMATAVADASVVTNAPATGDPSEVTNAPLPALPAETVPPTNSLSADSADAADANAAPAATTIPLIEFQDVPLTVAIENLARQAGINYLLDPKIGYGQPDQNGQVKAEPTLSIRWENVTAKQALLALLNNYDLQLVMDNKTAIGRITMKDPTAPPPLVTRVIQLK
ncbi:MAG: hypothetical protein ACREE6_14835, partial [Limisphaerales bacterium]